MNDFLELRTLEIDVQKCIFKVNGVDFSRVDELTLCFKNGIFSLNFSSNYFADGKIIQPCSENTGVKDSKKELLSKYFSEHEAEQLSNIITQDVPILIDGIQGPTGKTTLCSKLKALGYDAQELWETKKDERHDNSFKIIISLNETIT